ncbi:biotin/lipoyl-binding carrier protein [Nocardioides sp.]|uniref:biotin/lipoyl-binding carrier protein n=1 Tax=Nocardioides sp. TaxID=35761 RepID=UPI0035655A29
MVRQRTSEVIAEMVANVMTVNVEVGEEIEIGDTVAILESMKMEIPVLADHAGTVLAIKVAAADVVQEGDVLVEIAMRETN